ncbi:MAG: acetate kinase [Alphaproteobacteria bacterium]|nr:acetate kinase [Alphaproteobacteria bacterium]|tara:strand:+ start:23145 stop:24302 length:1158 start_codon:yes stop_codon:yes gene_type:complete
MRILVINAGSSSVKFGVFEGGAHVFKHSLDGLEHIEPALEKIPGILKENGYKNFDAIGHRIAHGGEVFREACIIDSKVISAIESCVPLAPLHNPPNLTGIRIVQKTWPDLPQVAVFDTAFHQTMPQKAITYAVPQEWRDLGLRRYGFHGTSHKYVMQRVAEELSKSPEDLRIISCHLGNGASICAIDKGMSVDTSMGMTALEGLVMGTRSGDVDPGLFAFLYRTQGLTADQIEKSLYSESGLKALAGSNDMRVIEDKAADGDKKAQLALDIYAYRVRKYIGAYAAVMDGADVLAFTGGIGEHSAAMRKRICEGLDFMGLDFDEKKNAAVKLDGFEAPQIQKDNAKVKVIVTQTREQWMIAREAENILRSKAVTNIDKEMRHGTGR